MLTTILSIIGTLVPVILQNTGVIGPSSAALVSGLTTQGINLFTSLQAGTSKTQDGLAALAAAAGVIVVLKANTSLPAGVLTTVEDVDKDVQAALTAYAKAGNGLDLTLYAQIAEV